jgi:hypothetical protein
MHRTLARLLAATALVALMLGGGTAFADDPTNQPTNVSSSEGRPEPDSLPPGPHCHVALRAGGNAAFDRIITATRHQAHVQTNVRGPGDIFAAADCP